MTPKNFFIVGCQRSGTTMLRLILESHDSIACKDEPGCYEILSDPKKIQQLQIQEITKKWIGYKIPRFAEQLDKSEIFDYGTPKILKPFQNFYKNDPIIFIIRDVRDVVCSMLELKAGDKSWIDTWGIPIIKYWIHNSSEFNKQFSKEINHLKKLDFDKYASAAFYWKFKNSSYFRYAKCSFPILRISYEKLVNDPKPFLKSIISFLDLTWNDILLKHHTLKHTEVNDKGIAVGNTDSRKPIDTFHIGRYKNELSSDELEKISLLSEDLVESLKYSN